MTAMRPVGRAVVEALEAEGTTTVFGIPGGHILPLYDAIYESQQITSILVRHEHAAAAMAAAYAQLTGTPGVVLATAGPGVTNVVTAVAEAFVGALPMIIDPRPASRAHPVPCTSRWISTQANWAVAYPRTSR